MSSKRPVIVFSQGGQKSVPTEAHLWVCSGKNIGRRFALDKPDLLIGRTSSADVPVVDERVSQQHALIETRDTGHVIRDLGSTNGTFVNNQRIHETVLRDGDLIQVGETVFEYLSYEERNLTITLRGADRQSSTDAVPAALRDEARQMLKQARHTPGAQVPPTASEAPHGYSAGNGHTVDIPAEDPSATGTGAQMGPGPLQRPSRGVGPLPLPAPPQLPPQMSMMPYGGPLYPPGVPPLPAMYSPPMEERIASVQPGGEEEAGLDLAAIIAKLHMVAGIFLPYWKSVLVLALLGLAGGIAHAKLKPPPAVAVFEVALHSQTSSNPLGPYYGRLQKFFQSAEQNFTSASLIQKTLMELGVENPTPAQMAATKSHLTFKSAGPPTPDTFTGTYTDKDPDRALRFLETHVKLYLESEVEKALKVLKAEADFLEVQVSEMAKDLRKSEVELMEFKKQNLESLPEHVTWAYQRLFELRTAESDALMMLSKSRRTRGMLQDRLRAEQPLVKTKASYDNRYQQAIVELDLQLAQERASGKGPDHPDIIKLEKRRRELTVKADAAKDDPSSVQMSRNPVYTEIQNEERNLQVQEQLAGQQLAHIRAELKKVEQTVSSIPELETERSDLLRSYQTTSDMYNRLLQQLQLVQVQLNLERASTAARYDVIAEPALEFKSKTKIMVMRGIMGLMLGLIVGLFAAGVRGVIAQGLIARIRALLKGNAAAAAPAPVAETALAPIEHGRRDLTR
ncbi:MAG: FHA domain-containing protein [Deltaproteobacteria bacterium]|nr:FHA domain-containing protein [Deltaproteobacteria bacterium]